MEDDKLNFNINPSIELLELFFNNNPKNQTTFRYFKNRNFDSIKNHILTLLLYQNNDIIGYGHLDKEDNITWLGIMLGDKYVGNGLGGIIMDISPTALVEVTIFSNEKEKFAHFVEPIKGLN
jgi:hypothetical protein